MGSATRVAYSLRVAKQIERKMLAEALRRLAKIEHLDRYRYVGMGALHFSDFRLFHRALGVTDMVDIEKDTFNKARYEFNRPFGCIDMDFGETHTVLPELPWDKKTILWLDYDGYLSAKKIGDLGTFCTNAVAGSAVIVTVNVEAADIERAVPMLYERFNEASHWVRRGLAYEDLRGWGLASVSRQIIDNAIREFLVDRNGGLGGDEQLEYRQLFNFRYEDSTAMLTTGGIIFSNAIRSSVEACEFDALPFLHSGSDAYEIRVPILTHREMRYLERLLPSLDRDKTSHARNLKDSGIPWEEVEKFQSLYRHFPTFAETDL